MVTSTHERRDARYLALATQVATIFSKDPSTRVGAVIVGLDHRNVALGYNGFPPGIRDDARLQNREVKYRLMIHAERNALDNAMFETNGSTLYVTEFPCHECAKSIVSKGVGRVVVPCAWFYSGWAERGKESIGWAQEMLTEAGIRWYEL